MVDFNNDSTVATPPTDIVKILILEQRQQITQSTEFYERQIIQGIESESRLAEIYGNVRHLWRQVKAIAKRKLKDAKGGPGSPTYQEIDRMIMGARTFQELDAAYTWLNEFIDEIGLTQIDNRARYDRTRIEDANFKKGL